MIIRKAEMSDLDIVSKIESDSFPKAEAASKESIKNRLKWSDDCFWVLEDYGEILSFINGIATDEKNLADEMFDHPERNIEEGDWLMIFSVATVPIQRHKGYSNMVMNQVIADSKVLNRKGIVLTCKEALLPFYSRFGFVNEGISQSTHGGAVWYQMRLTF